MTMTRKLKTVCRTIRLFFLVAFFLMAFFSRVDFHHSSPLFSFRWGYMEGILAGVFVTLEIMAACSRTVSEESVV